MRRFLSGVAAAAGAASPARRANKFSPINNLLHTHNTYTTTAAATATAAAAAAAGQSRTAAAAAALAGQARTAAAAAGGFVGVCIRSFSSDAPPLLLPFLREGHVPLFIGNEFVKSQTKVGEERSSHLVHCPATTDLLAICPETSPAELDFAVSSCVSSFGEWSSLPLQLRQRLVFDFISVLKEHREELAFVICKEQGKTLADARGEVFRGLEAAEHSLAATSLLQGRMLPSVASCLDTASFNEPLGVCAGITPSNFPATVPLWMFPVACVAGNTFLLKPSPRTPLSALVVAKCVQAAQWPPGVLNVVHGAAPTVDAICRHPDVKAISFVGNNAVGEKIFREATAHGKRVQCNLGAKNHVVLMPDACRENAINSVVSAAFGAAGQKCMATSVALLVGDAAEWIPDMVAKAKCLTVGPGYEEGVAMGPLVSAEAKARVCSLISDSVNYGSSLLLDGRNIEIPEHPKGYFLGPSIIMPKDLNDPVYQTEVFGPVLALICVDTLDEALQIINKNRFGNGTAIFTSSGSVGRKFQEEVRVGQVGINVAIPVPIPSFTFSGWNESFMGDLTLCGRTAFQFYTKTKTVTSRWTFTNDTKPGGFSLSFTR